MDLPEVKSHIRKMVMGVISSLPMPSVNLLVDHLVSNEVGVACLDDLKDITADMLPTTVQIPKLKQKQLLNAFASVSTHQDPKPMEPGHALAESANVPEVVNRGLGVVAEPMYTFKVPWGQIDKSLRESLEAAKDAHKKANPKVIEALKLAIMRKLVTNYKEYKERHPEVTQLHPGRVIYNSICDQIDAKYQWAVFTYVRGVLCRDSYLSFRSRFEQATDNHMRKYTSEKRKVVRGSDVIGVILEEYNPDIPNMEEQNGIMELLQNVNNYDPDTYDWEEIKQNMMATYQLQRDHIVQAKEQVEVAAAAAGKATATARDKNDENIDDPEGGDELNEKVLEKIKRMWPFLFAPDVLSQHHRRLTNRNLNGALKNFLDDHLRHLVMFMTSSTNVNVENIIIECRAEFSRHNMDIKFKFLTACEMLCKVFDCDLTTFVKTVEKTTPANTFEWTVLSDTAHPCIVACDNNMYKAEKFYICADKVPLLCCENPADTITFLIMVCFVFHLNYPPQVPKLFEFLERYVFGMGLADSKVRGSNGRQIAMTTEKIRKFAENYESFRTKVIEAVNEIM